MDIQDHHVTLNNGVQMPMLGFGVNRSRRSRRSRFVTDALEVGYRHLDTAAAYGNEEVVGRAITASGIARDELFITTKLRIQDPPVEENTNRAFEKSVQRLGLDHVDLYLIHQPYDDCYSAWRAMHDFHSQGLAKACGASYFHFDRRVDLILHNEVPPAVNQIETHPANLARESARRPRPGPPLTPGASPAPDKQSKQADTA